MSGYLARPYARALFSAVPEPQKEEVLFQLEKAKQVLLNPEMKRFSSAPGPAEEKAKLLVELSGSAPEGELAKLFSILSVRKRLAILPELADRFAALIYESKNKKRVELVSAEPVGEEQKKKLASALKAKYGFEPLIEEKLDSSLLGGAVLRIGDRILDLSLKGRLDKLSTSLSSSYL